MLNRTRLSRLRRPQLTLRRKNKSNLSLHISGTLLSFPCRLEPFWGVGRLLVVFVAVKTAGSQWRFEIR
jgi:hypothetical protein